MSKIEEIYLANGLKLNIFDLSRQIADDIVKVVISIQTEIDLKESYFSCPQDYKHVKSIFGNKLTYEHKMERSFVFLKNQESVRKEFINTFKNNSLNYLASANFPLNLALSRLRDIKNNPYKYNHGYEPPKQALETDSKARYGVLYPPLRGIVQLANSAALRFQNWSFMNKIKRKFET